MADQLLAARGADVNAARHGVDHAHSQRHPNVQFDGGYHLRDNETAIKVNLPGAPISALNDSQREGFTAQASINLPLYTSGRIENNIFAADARLQATEHDRATYRREMRLNVAREYIAVLLAERELTVAIAATKALSAHLHDVELMFQHERVPRNDLLAAEVAESNARQSVFQKESQLEASRASYNRRLGRPLGAPVRLAELTLPDVQDDVESLTETALLHRHELQSMDLQRNR